MSLDILPTLPSLLEERVTRLLEQACVSVHGPATPRPCPRCEAEAEDFLDHQIFGR